MSKQSPNPNDEPWNAANGKAMLCLYEALGYGAMWGAFTICLGGIGLVPGLIFGYFVGAAKADAITKALQEKVGDRTVLVRDVLSPEKVKAADEEWARENGDDPAQPDPRKDPLFQAMRSLGFTVAESLEGVKRSPEGPELPERLRVALQSRPAP